MLSSTACELYPGLIALPVIAFFRITRAGAIALGTVSIREVTDFVDFFCLPEVSLRMHFVVGATVTLHMTPIDLIRQAIRIAIEQARPAALTKFAARWTARHKKTQAKPAWVLIF